MTFLLLAFAAASSPTKKLQERSIAKLNELKLAEPQHRRMSASTECSNVGALCMCCQACAEL